MNSGWASPASVIQILVALGAIGNLTRFFLPSGDGLYGIAAIAVGLPIGASVLLCAAILFLFGFWSRREAASRRNLGPLRMEAVR